MQRPAIYYADDGFDTSGKRLVGRQAAGEGFLRALMRYTTSDVVYGAVNQPSAFESMKQRVAPWQRADVGLAQLRLHEPDELAQASVLYRGDPVLSELAWQRRFFQQRAYSLCGITHTICTRGAMQAICELATLPLQRWDAMICTSQAVRTAVDELLGNWQDYLAERTGGKPAILPQLPVIPLGVDCGQQQQFRQQLKARGALRKTLQIADDDVLVMFLGRLNFYTKAHPAPLWMAAAQAQARSKSKIHLLMVGWFENEREEKAYRHESQQFLGGVPISFLDGRQPELRASAWSAADLFVSPVDNVQETFGLTPLEAMAAGIPVIVSDWNGYRETVRDGVDGLRIPTIAPPSGSGEDLAYLYAGDQHLYSHIVARLSQATTVDNSALAAAIARLADDRSLREQMGRAAAAQAREQFDWRVIIGRYEALWEELAAIRQTAEESMPLRPGKSASPVCDDLTKIFSHYATSLLSPATKLIPGPYYSQEMQAKLAANWMTNYSAEGRLPPAEMARILLVVEMMPGVRIDQLGLATLDAVSLRSVGYLLKFGLLAVQAAP